MNFYRHSAVCALWMACGIWLSSHGALARDTWITVDATKIENRVSPLIYGSCIEDVNHEIYGGLYDQKIFGESFEEPAHGAAFQNWNTWGGDWKPIGEGIEVGASPGAKLVSKMPVFGDGSVETEVKFPRGEGGNAGLLLRVNSAGEGADNFDGYEISLQPNGRVILGKHRHNWQPLRDVEVGFTPTQWTRLRVQLDGARLRVFVGDSTTPQIDFKDIDAPFSTGTFALRTWNSDAQFQNVRVTRGSISTTNRFVVTNPQRKVSKMWDAIQDGATDSNFDLDNQNAYNGAQAQRLRHGAKAGTIGITNRGLNRWGIAVEQGQKLGGRLYLRGQDLRGAATLALQSADGQTVYATQTVRNIGNSWTKIPITLTPRATDKNARFAIILDKPGTLWIDQVVLGGTGTAQFEGMPIRADIARMMQAQGLRFLRYGGTMVNAPEYRWKNMVGDPDKRPPYRGHWYPYSTNGFGIEEFLRFCEAAKFDAAFAINIEETPEDIAAMVEYLNGAASTSQGKRRAQNGHPNPYKVRWIEIGNEEVIGSDNAEEYDHYIERFNLLADAIRSKDPTIQLVCSAWWRPESVNVERVFKALNSQADFWDLHVWSDDANAGTTVDRDLTQMKDLFEKWAPNTKMKCVIFEENGNLHNQQRALGHATTLNAVRRHGDFVPVSCPANALQPLNQNDNGWDQGQIFFTPDQVWGMPPFYAQQMESENFLPLRVSSACSGALDVTATRSKNGKVLVLHVVNTSENALETQLQIDGFIIGKTAKVTQLAAPLTAINTPQNPAQVQSQTSVWPLEKTGVLTFPFAPHSSTILRFG